MRKPGHVPAYDWLRLHRLNLWGKDKQGLSWLLYFLFYGVIRRRCLRRDTIKNGFVGGIGG